MGTSYQFLIDGIIPATQEAFKKTSVNRYIRREESASVKKFKEVVSTHLLNNRPPVSFPTSNSVFVAIIQFFTSTKKDYKTRDVDNMAKTVLDILEQNKFYKNDSQVRTLLVSKRVDLKNVPQNLGFIYVKVLEDGEDIQVIEDLLKEALKLYEDLKAGNVVNT